jgi:hypothetical protein
MACKPLYGVQTAPRKPRPEIGMPFALCAADANA